MAIPDLDRLLSQLNTTGLQQKDYPLYQVISQLIKYLRQTTNQLSADIAAGGGGGVDTGITQLIGDVFAGPGSGTQVSTIQPSVVTYAKIQDVTAEKLLGRDNSGDGVVQELTVGENLIIQNGQLDIELPGGNGNSGIAHNLLSLTHPDTIAASPIKGDLIYAGDAISPEGTFVNAVLIGNLEEDFVGIRAAYMCGFNHQELQITGVIGCYAPPPLNYIIPTPAEQWLTWDFIDAFIQSAVMDDFQGIRAAYNAMVPGQFEQPLNGVFGNYTSYPVDIIPAPDPSTEIAEGQWQRLPKGTNNQVLTIVDGTPQWAEGFELPEPLIVAELFANVNVVTPSIILDGYNIGIWTNVLYNAADFTASGGTTPTWTVASGDVQCFRYHRIRKAVTIQVFLVSTTVASVAGDVTELRIKIPDGMQAVGTPAIVVGAQEAGVATTDIYCTTEPTTDATLIFLRKYPVGVGAAFDQTPNGTFTGFTLIFEVL